MFVKVLRGAFLASALGAGCAFAQSASDIGGPRELPPASFSGQQYVDSRGCVFLRAGIGGRVNWVPRVDRDRRAMCGYPPTFGGGETVAAAPVVAPAPRVMAGEPPPESYTPAPVAGLRPVTVAPKPVAVAKPVAVPKPVAAAPVAPAAPPVARAGTGRQIGCTTSAPVPVRLRLTNGGTVVVCSRGDGTLEGLRAPIYPEGSGVGASLSGASRLVPLGQPAAIGTGVAGAQVAAPAVPVPKGYKLAWRDDRLNPLRGVGTAEGQAAQDLIWTRDIPAEPVEEAAAAGSAREVSVSVGAKNAPRRVAVAAEQAVERAVEPVAEPVAAAAKPVVAGRFFVQVGSFGVPANAEGAAGRLAALGLPVARSEGRIGGKPVQVILAGPFGDSGAAKAALRAARGAGFGDAFVK
ncbi:hypothetical protein C0V75_11825 [Tabrizicola sp. TH137]|uniref:SPOR domain-containing protein n=1 Tax=Tabrizicola sp. TH137 TaxID=2067452 RepID=UPI000C7C82E3|nr:SPOR domain-containing protein [Tabrizicola sp. TH137]PLL12608.1 hypothetical protein C0V75_11825 [Tabrizicola sp. TH137]